MKVSWLCLGIHVRGWKKVTWKRHESAMKVTWVWYEFDMSMLQWILTLFHGRFMVLSWYFPLWPCLDLPWKWHESALKVTWGKCPESATNLPDLHETYMSDSSRIHPGFMTFSFKPRSNLCQIHGTFMVVAWQFHGTFTSKPDLGTVRQSPLEKRFQKIGFGCRLFFFGDFNFIFCNMSDSCRFHGSFMALSPCWFYFFLKNQNQQLDSSQKWRSSLNVRFRHFHVTFMSFSTKQSPKQFHCSFMAFSLKLTNYWQSWSLRESAMKVTWFTWAWQFWSGRKCHESPMNLPWRWHEMFEAMFFGVAVKVPWKCHESAMKVPWKWHESDMNMTWTWYSGFRQFFMADSWHFPSKSPNCWNPPYHIHLRFLSLSCHFHGAFMAAPKKSARNTFIPFPWRFLWKLVRNSHISYLWLSVCLSSVCFFFFWYFFIDGFQVDQSFLFFLWSKYRVIRNTQTNNPNQQLSLSWFKNKHNFQILYQVLSYNTGVSSALVLGFFYR